jgi:hypothetical protein
LIALTYLACVIAPPVSLAFTDGAVAAHCLSEDHHVAAVAHVHADGTEHVHAKPHDHATHDHAKPHDHAGQAATHDHAIHGAAAHDHAAPVLDQKQADSSKDTDKKAGGTCCGLFCLSAAVEQVSLSISIAPRASILQPALEAPTTGLEPARIDRPPIVLVSF